MWRFPLSRILTVALLWFPLFSQSITFTKIVDLNTLRPDGKGQFGNPHTPSTDGRYVVFVDQGGPNESLWSVDLTTLRMNRLADLSTPVPGGSGNFTAFTQIGGGPYAGFNAIVRNGAVVFAGSDASGNGLYSMPASGGPITRIVNYNVTLPNGGRLGSPGHYIYSFGVNDNGVVEFNGLAAGNASDNTALGNSIYSASLDGSNVKLIADDVHRFMNPTQAPGVINSCVNNFGTAGINNSNVYFAGVGAGFYGIYSISISGPAQGAGPNSCGNGPVGPLVAGSTASLPGDPTPGKQVPQYNFLQTDNQTVYFHGCDNNSDCNTWNGIFSVPASGGAVTKIVEVGDSLPVIGTIANVAVEFSVDAGGVVFIARNAAGQRGIFLARNGTITKIFAHGDALNGSTLSPNGNLEVWPQAYKNGALAFGWLGGIFVATPSSTNPGAPTIFTGGVVPIFGTAPSIQPGSWFSIYGTNLITGTVPQSWNGDFPTALGGTSVSVNNKPAYLWYAAPGLINAQAPDDSTRGPVNVTVTTSSGSATSTVTLTDQSPSFSLFADAKHVAGIIVRPDGSGSNGSGPSSYDLLGPAGTSLGFQTVPARAGDVIVLFGVGFGPTNPPVAAGRPNSAGSAQAAGTIVLEIGPAQVTPFFSGIGTLSGLYQINFTMPAGIPSGDQSLVAAVNGVATQAGVLFSVR